MRAHDWVNKVEQPVATETVGRETQDKPGQASPEESREILFQPHHTMKNEK